MTVVTLLMHEMSRRAREEHYAGRDQTRQYGPRIRIGKVHRERHVNAIDRADVVRPRIDRFVVFGEQRFHVVRVRLVDRPKARMYVRLAEQIRSMFVRYAMLVH